MWRHGPTLEANLKSSVFRLVYNVWTSSWTHYVILHRKCSKPTSTWEFEPPYETQPSDSTSTRVLWRKRTETIASIEVLIRGKPLLIIRFPTHVTVWYIQMSLFLSRYLKVWIISQVLHYNRGVVGKQIVWAMFVWSVCRKKGKRDLNG